MPSSKRSLFVFAVEVLVVVVVVVVDDDVVVIFVVAVATALHTTRAPS